MQTVNFNDPFCDRPKQNFVIIVSFIVLFNNDNKALICYYQIYILYVKIAYNYAVQTYGRYTMDLWSMVRSDTG